MADGLRTVECSDCVAGCLFRRRAEAARCQSGNGRCSGSESGRSLWPEIDLIGQEMLLVLMLERSDRAGPLSVGPGEMFEGALASRGVLFVRRRPDAREMRPQVGEVASPAGEPAIGGGDGKIEVSGMPDTVK